MTIKANSQDGYFYHTPQSMVDKAVQLSNINRKHVTELEFDNIIDYLILLNYLDINKISGETLEVVFDLLNFNESEKEFILTSLSKVNELQDYVYPSWFTTTNYSQICTCLPGSVCGGCTTPFGRQDVTYTT